MSYLPNSHVEELMPKVLGDGALGRWLDHEGRGLVNSISIFIKEVPKSSLVPLPSESTSAQPGRGSSPTMLAPRSQIPASRLPIY